MSRRVDAALNGLRFDGGFLQLLNVKFDAQFNTAVLATQSAIQDVTQAEIERLQEVIAADTEYLSNVQKAQSIIIKAQAESGIIEAQAISAAMSINATLSAELTA